MRTDYVVYWLTHPDAIIYSVATALLYPVLFIELISLVFIVFETGRFCYEALWQYRKRDLGAMEAAALLARDELRSGNKPEALQRLSLMKGGRFFTRFFAALAAGGDLSRIRVMKRLGDLELTITKRLERTRTFIRIGPILGLMGTLIPISPALVALARGDVQTLASNLVVAFSTTVIGLLIGGLAYVMSVVRERRYTQDISDIEYVLETLES
ncbi:MAG: MotA/TolQ/ExbB proton channel family protein [Coriobacteriia bacterium]|nr:MotA/TolQ/ExbB proton channel family protein [Coriobacteriia bacterium]